MRVLFHITQDATVLKRRAEKVTKLVKSDQWITSGAVRYRPLGSTHQQTGIEIGLDYAKAPVPAHFYFADYLSVDEDSSQVMFTFGKLDKPVVDRLRSKVEVYFNPFMFVRQFWAQTREMHTLLQKYVESQGIIPSEPSKLLEAPKVQTFQSNNVSIITSEGESLLDFFYLSPKDVYYRPLKGEKIDIEALVRVILSPSLLLLLLTQSEPLVGKLLAKYGDKSNANMESK